MDPVRRDPARLGTGAHRRRRGPRGRRVPAARPTAGRRHPPTGPGGPPVRPGGRGLPGAPRVGAPPGGVAGRAGNPGPLRARRPGPRPRSARRRDLPPGRPPPRPLPPHAPQGGGGRRARHGRGARRSGRPPRAGPAGQPLHLRPRRAGTGARLGRGLRRRGRHRPLRPARPAPPALRGHPVRPPRQGPAAPRRPRRRARRHLGARVRPRRQGAGRDPARPPGGQARHRGGGPRQGRRDLLPAGAGTAAQTRQGGSAARTPPQGTAPAGRGDPHRARHRGVRRQDVLGHGARPRHQGRRTHRGRLREGRRHLHDPAARRDRRRTGRTPLVRHPLRDRLADRRQRRGLAAQRGPDRRALRRVRDAAR